MRSPDNLDWADDGHIYIQEDRATSPKDLFGATSGEEASIWRLDPESGDLTRVAQMDRSAIPDGQNDPDSGVIGAWESSGILDVSHLFGSDPGTRFLINVQPSLIGGDIESKNLVEGGQFAILENQNSIASDDLD